MTLDQLKQRHIDDTAWFKADVIKTDEVRSIIHVIGQIRGPNGPILSPMQIIVLPGQSTAKFSELPNQLAQAQDQVFKGEFQMA